ncbi:hypothetical protein BU23DRAFT_568331 [Bimuria novae-zelandiae CBS 107.79]|uniref:AB hydrolase-1 domain-containing protein n=1 Tax=Bimuria novae-zelandiae CBS 107.79 TaxID=1447943 RepID=A0A6A5VE58_9PLEO|nr:hypothetical protein BU23DRAFT_568331 [Bimuria novae-zelandiae CBS 107.79]
MDRPDPTIPEPLWIALSKLSHIVTREDTEPPLSHHRQYWSSNNTRSPTPIDPNLHSPRRSPSHPNPKPAFLLLHPTQHNPNYWSRLISYLHRAGYTTLAPSLPNNWDADIAVIRDATTHLARDSGYNIVVVLHGSAALAGTRALEGLDKPSCTQRGWPGGVVWLIYLGGDPMGEAVGHSASSAQSPHPLASPSSHATNAYAAWQHIPTTYILTHSEQRATVAAEEWIVKRAVESDRHKIDRVVRSEGGQTAFWSEPEWLAGMLVEEERSVGLG